MRSLKHFAEQTVRSPLAANVAAFAAAEQVEEVSRLATGLAMARTMEPAQTGIATDTMAVDVIMKSLAEYSVGEVLIGSAEDAVEATVRTVRRLTRGWCIALFVVRCALPAVLWSTASQWLGARGEVGPDFRPSLMTALAINTATLVVAPPGLFAVARAIVVTATVSPSFAAWPAFRLTLASVPAALAL